jgi:hypothetical protein
MQELRGAKVSIETWKETMQHAERLAKTAERKASTQRAHFTRRLAKMTVGNFFQTRITSHPNLAYSVCLDR